MKSLSLEDKIKQVAEILRHSRSIMFITGAGMSAESGLPTYRGLNGLYNNQLTEDGMTIEQALSGETLESNPAVTWKYLSAIEEKYRGAEPNRGHEIIKEIEEHFKRVWILTQNIEHFHQLSGSRNVITIHGDLYKLICTRCMKKTRINNYGEIDIPPVCPECGAIVRPEVVFFGEALPYDQCQVLMQELRIGFDVYFSIGTSSLFPYIQEPIIEAKREGKPTIEINPGQTCLSNFVDIKIAECAAVALEKIWTEYKRI